MTILSYSTNGLADLDLKIAINQLEKAGYAGIELTFQKKHFNPFTLTDDQISKIHTYFQTKSIRPVCISTPTMCFIGPKAHEPSVITLDTVERLRRVDLIKKGVTMAKKLHTNVVTFGSGFIREEHIKNPHINPMDLLLDSIQRILLDIEDNITLVIEPEPGMFIETLDDALKLIKLVNSPQFKLHLDLCHVFCTEKDYLETISKGIPYTKYFHISDASQGYNLKITEIESTALYDLNFAAYMIYFSQYDCFLLADSHRSLGFYTKTPTQIMRKELEKFLISIDGYPSIEWVEYPHLSFCAENEDEIYTYLNSIPKLSFTLLDKVKPILHYLRDSKTHAPIIKKMLSNTLTGKVHFHDIPGCGEINFKRFFDILTSHQFSGATTLELYHHVDDWENAMCTSINRLQKYI